MIEGKMSGVEVILMTPRTVIVYDVMMTCDCLCHYQDNIVRTDGHIVLR